MTQGTIPVLCECDSYECRLQAELPAPTVAAIQLAGLYVLVDGCKTGLSTGDAIVDREQGYATFRPPVH